MTGVADRLYQRLLEHPGDAVLMQVLADALEESGEDALAAAYRWAARRGRWPFARMDREDHSKTVYDWDTDRGAAAVGMVPTSAYLPRETYDVMRKLPDRKYGDVNDAFVLLDRALPGVNADAPA